MRSGMELVCKIQQTDWSNRRTRQTGLGGFDQAITAAIYFGFSPWEKNHPLIVQITHQFKFFTLRFPPRKKCTKEICFDKQTFFLYLQSNLTLVRCDKTCLKGPLEYKYCVMFVLVLAVICTL